MDTIHSSSRRRGLLSPYVLLDSLRQAVIATDPDGRIEYWNKGAERLYGWSEDEVVGRTVFDVTVPDLSRAQALEIMDHLSRGEDWSGQFTVRRKDGSIFEADVTDKPVFDKDGHLVGIIGLSEDVTSRLQALDALQHSEERFLQATETVPDIFFIADTNIQGVYINRRFTEYTGKPARYMHDNGWVRVLHPDEVQIVLRDWGHRMQSGEPAEFKHRIRMADGSYRWFITRTRPVRDERGSVRYWIGTSTDVDDLVRAEEKIKALNATLERRVHERTEQVRALSSALTLAEQRERQRVARLLHDDLQQLLYGIKLKSEALRRDLGDEGAQEKLGELGASLSNAIQAVRSLSIELSPPVLKGEGLEAALTWLALHLKERYGIQIDVRTCSRCDIPHEDQRILIFQIVRELLFNVVKHAGTDRAEVTLDRRNDHLRVRVCDEGVGFNVEELGASKVQDTFGLVSIRERLELFGGSLEVESATGAGTTVTVITPIE